MIRVQIVVISYQLISVLGPLDDILKRIHIFRPDGMDAYDSRVVSVITLDDSEVS